MNGNGSAPHAWTLASAKHTAEDLEGAQNRRRAVELKTQGWTMEQIGAELGCAPSTACKWIKKALREIEAPAVAEYRAVMDMQLDGMWKDISPGEGEKWDPKAVEAGLKILERRAKLFGLDAKQQVDLTVSNLPETLNPLREKLGSDDRFRDLWLQLADSLDGESPVQSAVSGAAISGALGATGN